MQTLTAGKLPPLNFASLLRPGDALIVVPPFVSWNIPSISAHLLQACARQSGFRVTVLYANVLFATLMGGADYLAAVDGYYELREARSKPQSLSSFRYIISGLHSPAG